MRVRFPILVAVVVLAAAASFAEGTILAAVANPQHADAAASDSAIATSGGSSGTARAASNQPESSAAASSATTSANGAPRGSVSRVGRQGPRPSLGTVARAVALVAGPAWTTRPAGIVTAAGSADAEAHVGAGFAVTVAAQTALVGDMPWVEVTWRSAGGTATGWIAASALTQTRPQGVATAGVDALDPQLAAYLASLGDRVGVQVYDVTRGVVYGYNATAGFTVASSIKIEIMAAFLADLEAQGRSATADEQAIVASMIENSNNDDASYLYAQIGDAPGLTAYMARIGVSGLVASPGTVGWGWSTITPEAQVQVLALLDSGQLLTPADTAYALALMSNVESDQREGVADTAPAGAAVAMKVGWVNGPDGLMVMNSSGIVSRGGETYIVSVYTVDDQTLDEGWDIANHVCGAVATAVLAE